MGLALTHRLRRSMPLRGWFASRLPNIDVVLSDVPTGLRPVVPRRRPALPPWLIGQAFDWRLRVGIDVPEDPAETAAYAGWLLLYRCSVGRGTAA